MEIDLQKRDTNVEGATLVMAAPLRTPRAVTLLVVTLSPPRALAIAQTAFTPDSSVGSAVVEVAIHVDSYPTTNSAAERFLSCTGVPGSI